MDTTSPGKTATVDIRHFYDLINGAWKFIKAHETIELTKDAFEGYFNEIQKLYDHTDDVAASIYGAAYRVLMNTAVDSEK